jgi:alpha-D-ribose 1-methylphosphonate 5-triphosphate synthase subunit PhnL
MTHHLKVESLSKSFDLHMLGGRRIWALGDVSFAVRRGEFLGVVGRSGSGKSSLLRCLYRRYLPTSGSMLYYSEGGEATDLAVADDRVVLRLRREELGYVSQFLQAIPRTPARDVVAEPLVVRGASPEAARERSQEMLASLGLVGDLQEAYPATMSGGEQQRVNLARALVARPRLLLLDEPTGALDPETRELAVAAIKELKEGGTTMIGVFHDPGTLGALADRVLVLEDQKVRWCGPASEAPELMTAAGA